MRVAIIDAALRVKRSKKLGSAASSWVVGMVMLTLLLSACGDTPTPVPPTPTPLLGDKFQQETNQELYFTMNFPTGWNRSTPDPNTVLYTKPEDANYKVAVYSKAVTNLKPTADNLLQQLSDQVKSANPGTKEDIGGGGTLTLLDTSAAVNRLGFTVNNVDVLQYIAQINNAPAERAYVLYATAPAKDSATYQPFYFDCFQSFTSTAPNVARGQSGVADLTVKAAQDGGRIHPENARETKGQYLRLVEWQTPPLNPNTKQPIITGTFPLDYTWRVKPFPTKDQPSIYLSSPVVDATTNQAVMQIAVYKDAFKTASPSADDWKNFYTPVLTLIEQQYVASYGFSIQPINIAAAGPLYRAPFTARSNDGVVRARGFIVFGHSGTNAILGILSISPESAVKQPLVDAFDRDFQTIISSLQVKY